MNINKKSTIKIELFAGTSGAYLSKFSALKVCQFILLLLFETSFLKL